VRVIVPRDSDVKAAQFASRALYDRLMSSGIEIHEWRAGVLHSKTAVIDDDWCTVGTFNFDALSIHNNLEVNVAVLDKGTNAALRARMEQDLECSSRIDLATWRKRSIILRAIERLFYALRWAL
jgi:cardiolipin synthase